LSQFINSIKEVKNNYKTYDEWEKNQSDDAAKKEYLSKTVEMPNDKVELTTTKAKIVARASELLDKRSEDNCQNMERTTGLVALAVLAPVMAGFQILQMKMLKSGSKKISSNMAIAQMLVPFALGIGLTLWGNKKQKEASRLGRFQAKKNELKDAKNFVAYTPEQIKAAEILAKKTPDKKEDKSISKLLKDMKQASLDKKEYKNIAEQKAKNPEDTQKILNTKFAPKQTVQGEEDKEIIVNIVKDINVKAEEYSENAESVFDTMGTLSFIGSIPIGFGINKILKQFKNVPTNAKMMVPMISSWLITLGVAFWATSEKKESSRVGRFIQREKILKNPKNLMVYSDAQLKQAENIKSDKVKKGFFEKLGSNFKFLKTYLNDKKDYEKYQKTEGKNNEKLYDALKQTEVSQSQLKDAKHIQEKTFKAFDKIDEMSQRYSEDVEAGTEIAKNTVGLVWGLGSMTAMALLGFAAQRGKLPLHKIIKGASNIALDKGSSIRNLINQAYEIANKDKNIKENLCKSIYSSEARVKIMKNPQLAPIIETLQLKIAKNLPKLTNDDVEKSMKEIIEPHFKQGPVSKWFRNIAVEISKFWAKGKISGTGMGIPEAINEKLKFNYANYKTLINSSIIGAVPAFGLLVSVPYAFNAWMTNIQKKAGKIGIMKAMDEIDKTNLYVNPEENAEVAKPEPAKQTSQSSNLLSQFATK